MASPLPEKTLRAMQDAFSLYETLSSSYANYGTPTSLPSPGCSAFMDNVPDVDSAPASFLRLGVLAALVYADNLEGFVLGR